MAQQSQSRMNLNTCSVQDLMQIQGIEKETAQRIIDYRNQHGPFKSCDDLSSALGFDESLVKKMKSQLTCD